MNMMTLLQSVLILCMVPVAFSVSPLRRYFPVIEEQGWHLGDDVGKPLFLTPYIKKGDIQTAQKLSRVDVPGLNYKSYSGFLTVSDKYRSNMFFWYFPSLASPSTDPLCLWLQGGPGGSSLFALFVENGPVMVTKDLKLAPRKYGWTNKFSMLYIDNPVGTGYSFTESDMGYSNNETEVAENLYIALTQFFKLFPHQKNNEFYLTGESYAGKYIPALAHRLLNQEERLVPLTGVAIGDAWSDPQVMIAEYAPYLFNLGMLDENERDYIQKGSDEAIQFIKEGRYIEANNKWGSLAMFITNVTGSHDLDNYMRCRSPPDFGYYGKWVVMPTTRKGIHVGNLTYNNGDAVENHLLGDIMKSVKPWLAEVMDKVKVMLYSGQLDIIVAAPLTEAMLQTVPWKYLPEYKNTKKLVWKVSPSDTEVAGYVRVTKQFYQVIVRGGGHILPHDQPLRSFDMIDRFITNRGFY